MGIHVHQAILRIFSITAFFLVVKVSVFSYTFTNYNTVVNSIFILKT